VFFTGIFNAYFPSALQNNRQNPKNGRAETITLYLLPKKEKERDVMAQKRNKSNENKLKRLKNKLSFRFSHFKNPLALYPLCCIAPKHLCVATKKKTLVDTQAVIRSQTS
jgi:hypothetical protein